MIENQHAVTPTDSRQPVRLLRPGRDVHIVHDGPRRWPWEPVRWAPALFTFAVGALVGAMLLAVGAALVWPGVFA